MLDRRRRRRANIGQTLGRCVVFARHLLQTILHFIDILFESIGLLC